MIPDPKPVEQQLYEAYGKSAGWKNFRGDPMPQWHELDQNIQSHWRSVSLTIYHIHLGELNAREKAQIAHAQDYFARHSEAGVPGHGQFILIAKLANALGL